LSRVFKPSTRVKPVSRWENAAVASAVRGLEPRAPELEIPRPLGVEVARSGETYVNLDGWLKQHPRRLL
jgi:hypothetical protein